MLMPEFIYNKLAGLKPCNFIKKRLWYRCFPVNFAKFLKTPILMNIFERIIVGYEAMKQYVHINILMMISFLRDHVLFNVVVVMKACSFTKQGLQHRYFSVKIIKLSRIPFLQNTARCLVLSLRTVLNVSLDLSAIYKFSHSSLYRTSRSSFSKVIYKVCYENN